ncbi:hypothetical protein R3Q06_34925 [Rhodococcus erythropolis]|uniref:hypothetical protein n=1 Tax=Rhodococcus erythropolis TaxID=1833 RepID=UPI002949D156|nr:hypothetical protein [Rhodococcus erythropolis]MDV6278587.1 hypothetical protein [Rhodococcus erythropolis]
MAKVSNIASGPRRKMLRAMLVAPVVVGVLAGSVAAGTGVGAAAPADPDSTYVGDWTLHNYTDQVLTQGSFTKRAGDDWWFGEVAGLKPRQSRNVTRDDSPLPPSPPRRIYTTSAFGVCYKNTQWKLDSTDTSEDKWRDTYIFADASGKLFITPEGAKDNRFLERTGSC